MDPQSAFAPSDKPLVDIHGIGPAVFGESCPSTRTLRTLTRQGILPHFKIGRLVRYDPRLVRAALELRCLIQAKKSAATPTGKART